MMRFLLLTMALWFSVLQFANGQIQYFPIKHDSKSNKKSARTENAAVPLPFWDDFSFTKGIRPLDSLWQNSEGVYVGNGIANNPPSIGAATLDGISADGSGYLGSTTGPTDALTSCPILLAGLTEADNIYLSFYYQFAGNGEQPEITDSLRVEFKNSDGEWIPVWPAGAELDRSEDFVQALVKVEATEFFHDDFQFKIQSFGRPQGFFDVWNIDYVYVNDNRSATDDNYPDRTISSPLSSIFNGFNAIPARHYRTSQNITPSFFISSVDNPADDEQPYDHFYFAQITSWKDSISTFASTDTVLNGTGIIDANQQVEEDLTNLFDDLNIQEEQDSIFIELTTFINATDNVLPPEGDFESSFNPIDFRNNDTIRNSFILKDYYAYDDGTAEVAAGLNFSNNRLAIKFPVTPEVIDTLVAVDMYFALTDIDPTGRSIEVFVWDNLQDQANSVLFREAFTISRDPEPNAFVRYTFKTPVILADTFYIGYRQNNEGKLGLGFDYSNNTNDKVYFNVGSGWQQKSSEDLPGSFMLRPVFGNTVEIDPTTGLDPGLFDKLQLYPNPINNWFTINGQFDNFVLSDIYGRAVMQGSSNNESATQLDTSALKSGLYLITIQIGKVKKTYKLIKE